MKLMNKPLRCVLGMTLILALTVGLVQTGWGKEPNQTRCPVLGNPVNKKLYVDHDGKRVYFCCPPCIPRFKKDPEKYVKQMEQQGVVLEPVLKN